MATDTALSVQGVSKHYTLFDKPFRRLLKAIFPGYRAGCSEFRALDRVSFELGVGETLGIIGRNGSGKSTLLQIVAGTVTPSEGKVSCRGRVAALLELGAGFDPDFTGRENARINAAIYGLTKEDIEAKLPEIIAFAEIGEFIDQPVRHYSSGMFVRLAFAVIAHVDADVLIIDEALAVGDVLFSQKCMRFLDDFKRRGSILFVSHDAGAVSRLCDRVMWLDKGRSRGLGAPREMLDQYLEYIYGEQQELAKVTAPDVLPEDLPIREFEAWYDAREEIADGSALYNEITIYRFDENAKGFGDGGASIVDVCFRDMDGRKLTAVLGGTPVSLNFSFYANKDLEKLIVGFLIRDRLGQVILGDNNCIIHHDSPKNAEKGKSYTVSFGLTLPYLAVSEYIVSVAVASGSQAEHVQHCWLHDALVFRAERGPVVHGIMGIPMAFCDIRELG